MVAPAAPLRCLAARPTMLRHTLCLDSLHTTRAGICSSSRLLRDGPPVTRSRIDLIKRTKNKSTYQKKTSRPAATGKKPEPGERKAYRKRIQLSNQSALPVRGMIEVERETLANSDNAGKVVALSDTVIDQLRGLQAFKPGQNWNLFNKPHFLVRGETTRLVGAMNEEAEAQQTLKCILTGSRWTGKSMMMLQAMAHALVNEWVVIHIPEGQDLTNGTTEYAPLRDTSPLQFIQPTYCLSLLKNIYAGNRAVLERLPLQFESSKAINLKASTNIAELVLNARDSEVAWPALQAMWKELLLPGRPRVLLALDGLSHINRLSKYRDPSFNWIHSHDLGLVRMFVDVLSGRTPLPNGGVAMAATSGNNTFAVPSLDLAIAQIEATQNLAAAELEAAQDVEAAQDGEVAQNADTAKMAAAQAGYSIPQADPYERGYDDRVYEALKEAWVLRIEGISHPEARALMEYWGASGLVRTKLDSRAVTAKWVLGGHGIVGEMERATLLTMNL